EAQLAPMRTVLADDFDGDGRTDLLVAGNDWGFPPVLGRADASYGLLLRGTGDGRFSGVDLERSGVVIDGQVRHMGWLRRADGSDDAATARRSHHPRGHPPCAVAG